MPVGHPSIRIAEVLKLVGQLLGNLHSLAGESDVIKDIIDKINNLRNVLARLNHLPHSDRRWDEIIAREYTDDILYRPICHLQGLMSKLAPVLQSASADARPRRSWANRLHLKSKTKSDTGNVKSVSHQIEQLDLLPSLILIGEDCTVMERIYAMDPSGITPLLNRVKDVSLPTPSGLTYYQKEQMSLREGCLLGHEEVVRARLQRGENASATLDDGSSLLHASVGHDAIVRLLLAHGADANAQNKVGMTPLHEAVESFASVDVLAMLLKGRAEINALTKSSMRVERGHILNLSQLTAENRSCDMDSTNRTPLYIAADNNNVSAVNFLLSHGAKVDAQSSKGATPLLISSFRGFTDIVKMLLDRKANPNQRCDSGLTSAIAAAEKGHVGVMQLLLKYNADISLRPGHMWSPMLKACVMGQLEIVKLLHSAGGDITETLNNGAGVLHFAASGGDLPTMRYLISQGLDINSNSLGGSVLHMACAKGHLSAVELLLDNGASTRIRLEPSGFTPLHLAIQEGKDDIVRALLSRLPAADLEVKDNDGRTPLRVAVGFGREIAVNELLSKGANPNCQDAGLNTPLLVASMHHSSLIPTLRRHGARLDIKNENGTEPLKWALQEDNSTLAAALLEQETTLDRLLVLLRENNDEDIGLEAWTDPKLFAWAIMNNKEVLCWVLLKHYSADPRSFLSNPLIPPLIVALKHASVGIVRLLLKFGADVHRGIPKGVNPIFAAVASRDIKKVEILIEYGCNVNNRGDTPMTALALAQQAKLLDITQLLLSHGAEMTLE